MILLAARLIARGTLAIVRRRPNSAVQQHCLGHLKAMVPCAAFPATARSRGIAPRAARRSCSRTLGTTLFTFHLVGLDKRGVIVLHQKVTRHQLARRLSNIPRCLV